MRRYKANGPHIKELRQRRDRGATQKEFAHELDVSERKLRKIENECAEITRDLLERIAKSLAVPWQSVVFAADQPRLVAGSANQPAADQTAEADGSITVPRFDTDIAHAVTDEAELLSNASESHTVLTHIFTKLTSETETYIQEMIDVLRSVSWISRDQLIPLDGRDEIELRRRLRELLVLLRGNDVWVYMTKHFKYLPESYIVQPKRDFGNAQMQAIVAFGPPGEYGETTVTVPVDNGQPWVYDPNAIPF